MKLFGKTTSGSALTVAQAQAEKDVAERELNDWRARAADVATRLTAAQTRAEDLRTQAAAATLEGADPKGARRERAAALAEVEELELAQGMAAEKNTGLEAVVARAARRLLIAIALERLDRLGEIAERVESMWSPLREGLGELLLAHEEAAGMLDKLVGGRHVRDKTALTVPLLWRLEGFVELPNSWGVKKESLPEFFAYALSRARLERELTDSDTKETV